MNWFRKIMPKEDAFFDHFEDHARLVAAGALSLRLALDGGPAAAGHMRDVVVREDHADAVTRQVLLAVRKSFITPFDRGAIKDLITAMDDSIDQMNKTVRTVNQFEVSTFSDGMREMGDRIVSASALVVEILPRLRRMGVEANAILVACEQVTKIEGEADDIHLAAVTKLWKERGGRPAKDPDNVTVGDIDAMHNGPEKFLVGERILDSLEKVMDRLEDVADVVQSVVIEHV